MAEPVSGTLAVVGTAKKVLEFVKDAKALSDKVAQQEIQKMMLQIQEEALALQAENIALKGKLQELENSIKVDKNIEIINGMYFLKSSESDKKKGPFCQKCKDVDDRLVNLQDHKDGTWQCLNCNNWYGDSRRSSEAYATDYDPLDGF